MKKAVMYVANRLWIILTFYVASIFVAGFFFAIFESRNFSDGLWWAVVTALTIGYGDFSPVTLGGRLTGVIFGHIWIFGVIPMVVSNIIVNVLEDKNAFTHQEQEWLEKALAGIAQKLDVKIHEAPPDY